MSKTENISVKYKKIEEALAKYFGDFLDYGGKLAAYFIMLAITSALYIKFIPTINEDLSPIFRLLFPKNSFKPSSLILGVSVFSTTITFILIFLGLLLNFAKALAHFLISSLTVIYSKIISLLQALLLRIGKRGAAKKLSKIMYFYKTSVYFNEYWHAKSRYSGLELIPPIEIKDFEYARCHVKVISQVSHWRAGIIFVGPERREYIFHVHEDFAQPGLLKSRIVFRIPTEEIRDSRRDLPDVKDVKEFDLSVKKQKDKLTFSVNQVDIDSFNVPLHEIKTIKFGAWADDRPFDIEFKNIEVVA